MKTKLFYKIIFLSILILFVVFSSSVLATNDVNTTSGEVIASYETDYKYTSSDMFYYDSEVNISEVIDGNVFAYGQTVNVTGEIYGDLFVAGNTINIGEDAIIHGNIFVFANTVEFSGICSDVYSYGSNFTLSSSGMIARNLNLAANEVKLNGQISRDANIYCVSISFGNDNEEIISGNLNYSSENEQSIPDGVVGGETKYTAIETNTENIILSIIKSILSSLIFSFIIIMLLLWIAPKFKDKASEIVKNNSFKAFGIGLLVLFGIIIAAFMLLLFTYGLAASIAVVGIVLLALAYVVSNTIFSMSIGKLIANKLNLSKNVAFVLFSLLIVLILGLIKYIPYVGGPINFITSIIGLGIISINAFKRKDLTISKKIESES